MSSLETHIDVPTQTHIHTPPHHTTATGGTDRRVVGGWGATQLLDVKFHRKVKIDQ